MCSERNIWHTNQFKLNFCKYQLGRIRLVERLERFGGRIYIYIYIKDINPET